MRVGLLLLHFMVVSAAATGLDWETIPDHLTAGLDLDYSGPRLQERWDTLLGGIGEPFPTPRQVAAVRRRFPSSATPGMTATHEATAAQEAWAALFAGRLARTLELGAEAGSSGRAPAIYAQITYAFYLATSPTAKERLLREAVQDARDLLELIPDSRLGRFALAYALVRIMEDQQGAVSGRALREAKSTLERLLSERPESALCAALLGGIHGGPDLRQPFQRLARLIYGVTPEAMERSFATALRLRPDVPLVHVEYAHALVRTYADSRLNLALEHLRQAARMQPRSALEALDINYARGQLRELLED